MRYEIVGGTLPAGNMQIIRRRKHDNGKREHELDEPQYENGKQHQTEV